MTFEEKLEMKDIIVLSGLPDEKIGRLNELMNLALDELKMDGYKECLKKIDELRLAAIDRYGIAIPEMYKDVYDEFVHWAELKVADNENS